jgi:transposase-like protein
MARLSFNRHRSPADVIRHTLWLCFRFTLSFRDVEQLLAQCGTSASCGTLRCRTIEFGPQIAAKLRHRGAAPWPRRHLGELICNIDGERAPCTGLDRDEFSCQSRAGVKW